MLRGKDLREILWQQKEFAAIRVMSLLGWVCVHGHGPVRSHNSIASRRPAGWPADFCPQQHSSSQSINCPIHYKVIPASQGTATQHAAHKAQRHLHVKARFKYVYHIEVSGYSSRSSVAAHLPTSEKYTSCNSPHCSFFSLLFLPVSSPQLPLLRQFQTRIRQHIIVNN